MTVPPIGRTMQDWLRQRAATTPERLALIAGAARLSFCDLDQRVDAMAAGLLKRGVRRGAVVALLATNSVEFVTAEHAVARLGGVLVPLNLRLALAELAWQLADCGASVVLHDAHNAGAAVSAAEGPKVRCLGVEEAPSAGDIDSLPPNPTFDLDAVQTVVYTSGTSGRPKGAMLTYANHLWSAVGSALNLGLLAGDRWLCALPLFHVGGLCILHKSVIYGMTCVLHDGFDPERVNRSIDEDGVTIVSVVSAMLQRLLDERGPKPYPPSLRCALLGGGPAPLSLLEACAARNVPVVQTYGLTETASQIATLAPDEALTKLGSAGKPLFGSELRITDDEGRVCAPGEAGEISVRGPTVTAGYLNRPDETARLLQDGWLRTGDAGYIDAQGYLYVLDRRDDLIVSGGENVYPAEIEATLQAHPAVLEAGVYGVDDARWGRVPVGVVVLRPDAAVTPDELLAFCRERLAHYKVPARLVFTTALPRNAAGKLLRRDLARLDAQMPGQS